MGDAKNSLKAMVTEDGLSIVGNRYVGALDKGRRPGKFPPVQVIRDWVASKLGITGQENSSIAFLVGRKISIEGTNIYKNKSEGLELENVKNKGVEMIKQQVTHEYLKLLSAEVKNLGSI